MDLLEFPTWDALCADPSQEASSKMSPTDLSNLIPSYLANLPSGQHGVGQWYEQWTGHDIIACRGLAAQFVKYESEVLKRLSDLLQSPSVKQYSTIDVAQSSISPTSKKRQADDISPMTPAKRIRLDTVDLPVASRTRLSTRKRQSISNIPRSETSLSSRSDDTQELVSLYSLQVRVVAQVEKIRAMLEGIEHGSQNPQSDTILHIIDECTALNRLGSDIRGLSNISKTCDLEIIARTRKVRSPAIEAYWLGQDSGLIHGWIDSSIMKASSFQIVPASPDSLERDRVIR